MPNNQTQINLIKTIFNKLINDWMSISLAAKTLGCSGDDLNQIYQDYLIFDTTHHAIASLLPEAGLNQAICQIEKLLNPELYKGEKEEPITLKDQCYTAFTDYYNIDDNDETFDDDLQQVMVKFNQLVADSQNRYSTDEGRTLANLLNDCLDKSGYYLDHQPDDDGKFSYYRLQKSGLDIDFDLRELECSTFDEFVTKLQKLLDDSESQKTKYYCIEVIKRNEEGKKFSEISGNRLFDTEQKAKDYIISHTIPKIGNGDRRLDVRSDDGSDPTYIAFDNDTSYNFYITTLTF
jgi:hypothetical protein